VGHLIFLLLSCSLIAFRFALCLGVQMLLGLVLMLIVLAQGQLMMDGWVGSMVSASRVMGSWI
jgi:hypothetical protein